MICLIKFCTIRKLKIVSHANKTTLLDVYKRSLSYTCRTILCLENVGKLDINIYSNKISLLLGNPQNTIMRMCNVNRFFDIRVIYMTVRIQALKEQILFWIVSKCNMLLLIHLHVCKYKINYTYDSTCNIAYFFSLLFISHLK